MLIPLVFLLLAWLRLATFMPMSPAGVFGLFPPLQISVCVAKDILKECARETVCSGGYMEAEVQFPFDLLEGCEESRQGSEGMEL